MAFFRLLPLAFIVICITLSKAAPLPNNHISLNDLERRDSDESSLLERSLADLWDRDTEQEADKLERRDSDESSLLERSLVDLWDRDMEQEVDDLLARDISIRGLESVEGEILLTRGLLSRLKNVATKFKKVMGKVDIGKVLSTGEAIASQAAKFAPGIGKPLSTALNVVSKATGFVSDKNHA